MLERTDAITNEVLEPITFVLAYRTVLGKGIGQHLAPYRFPESNRKYRRTGSGIDNVDSTLDTCRCNLHSSRTFRKHSKKYCELLNLYPHENIRYSYSILVGQKHDINIQSIYSQYKSIIYRKKLRVTEYVLMTCC
jgi:hypothetical protein